MVSVAGARVKDTVTLITGGAGHVGGCLARKVAAAGGDLVIVDKDNASQDAFITELQSLGVRCLYLTHDLSKPEAIQQICHDVEANYGRLDNLVNNAAFYDDMPGWGVPFAEESNAAWQAVLQVNLLAPFFLAQGLHSLLRQSERASIVNVSSIYGIVGPDYSIYDGTEMTNPAAYAASKGGLIQLSRWLSTTLAPEVRVNSVTLGGIARGQDEGFVEKYQKKTPLKRMATEDDVVGAMLFLLSEQSGYVTGQNIVVDGGWTAW